MGSWWLVDGGQVVASNGGPRGQSWGTFLRNHMPHIAAMDLFVVPTIRFDLLYVLVIVRLARRELVWINVTAHPTAEWIAQQITEALQRAGFRRYWRWKSRNLGGRPKIAADLRALIRATP